MNIFRFRSILYQTLRETDFEGNFPSVIQAVYLLKAMGIAIEIRP